MREKYSYLASGIIGVSAIFGAYVGGVGVNNLLVASNVPQNLAFMASLITAYSAGKFGLSMGMKAGGAVDDFLSDIAEMKRQEKFDREFEEKMRLRREEREKKEVKKEYVPESERQIFIPHKYDKFAQIYIDDVPIALYLHLPDEKGDVSNKLYNLGYIEKTEQNRAGTMITFEGKPFKELNMFDKFKEWEKQVKKSIAMKNQKPVKSIIIESNVNKGKEYSM